MTHHLSAGRRQRVLVAGAVILNPAIIIADEAVSALGVSVKASTSNSSTGCGRNSTLGYLFITHDLPVVQKVADYVYVMKNGQMLEDASKAELVRYWIRSTTPQTESVGVAAKL